MLRMQGASIRYINVRWIQGIFPNLWNFCTINISSPSLYINNQVSSIVCHIHSRGEEESERHLSLSLVLHALNYNYN